MISNIFKITFYLTFLLFGAGVGPDFAHADDLTEALTKQALESKSKLPAEKASVMQGALDSLQSSKITELAPKVGQILPDGILLDVHGATTSLYKTMGDGNAIVTFYRGGWCPYCNLQLHSYATHLKKFEALGGKLIAISPETPSEALSTIEKDKIEFAVLSDDGNQYARTLKISYKLEPDLVSVYRQFDIDLTKNQGVDSWELPLAATFVINKEKVIQYAFVDVDYKKRAEPSKLIEVLKTLK